MLKIYLSIVNFLYNFRYWSFSDFQCLEGLIVAMLTTSYCPHYSDGVLAVVSISVGGFLSKLVHMTHMQKYYMDYVPNHNLATAKCAKFGKLPSVATACTQTHKKSENLYK